MRTFVCLIERNYGTLVSPRQNQSLHLIIARLINYAQTKFLWDELIGGKLNPRVAEGLKSLVASNSIIGRIKKGG